MAPSRRIHFVQRAVLPLVLLLALSASSSAARPLDEAVDRLGRRLADQMRQQQLSSFTMLPWVNLSGAPSEREARLASALVDAVAEAGGFRVIAPERALEIAWRTGVDTRQLVSGEVAAGIGREAGAAAVLTATIASHGSGVLLLEAQAFSSQRGVHIASAEVRADEGASASAARGRPEAAAPPTHGPPRAGEAGGASMVGTVWAARLAPTTHPWWLACPEAEVQLADAGRLLHRCRPGESFDHLSANGWRQEGRTLVVTFASGDIQHVFPEALTSTSEISAPSKPVPHQTLHLRRASAGAAGRTSPAPAPDRSEPTPRPESADAFATRDPSGAVAFRLRSVSRGSSGVLVVEVEATNAGERVEIGIDSASFALDSSGSDLPLRAIRLSGRNASVAGKRGLSTLRARVPNRATVVLTAVFQPPPSDSQGVQLIELALGEFGVHVFRDVPLPYSRR